MAKKKKQSSKKRPVEPGHLARASGKTLRSYDVGALPIINRILERMRLSDILQQCLPADDSRTQLPTRRGLMVLIRNLLIAREPVYGVGQWACGYAPGLLDLWHHEVELLNDDRVGRCLDRLFDALDDDLIMKVVRQVTDQFQINLDELHNDSTSVSFFGAYSEAEEEGHVRGRRTLAITFGHSKDHRPDLKQLLYILTVTEDGGVPIYFTSVNGNTTDDTTHRRTWDLLHELVGRPDFLYVADCKLATSENMNYIARQQGRPNKNTKYVKKVKKRFDISWSVDSVRWAEAESLDGIFPLITNVKEMTAEEILRAYKRQPIIEKRFSQLKTDFSVAPVYLKSVTRIQALLAVYFFVLIVQTLLQRELRQAMQRAKIETLPLYPEGRACRRPTTRKMLDLFDGVQRHELKLSGREPEVMVTQLSPLQKQILKLLGISEKSYGH